MDIGIIGSGISGLTLALRLQQLGVETTVYTDKTADQLTSGRLLNSVARFDHTLARERAMAVADGAPDGYGIDHLHVRSVEPLPLSFLGRARRPMRGVDFRLLLPRFMEQYEERGGSIVLAETLETTRLTNGHDLVVVAVGRTSVASLFPADAGRSPFTAPQRQLFAGFFDGLDASQPAGVSFNISPGAGEIFQMPIWSADGLAQNILLEAVPGGPLAVLTEMSPADDQFVPTMIELLGIHAPAIAERVDARSFAIRGPLDVLQGAITPAVRHAYAQLPDGTAALAIGDAWITNDPITGQGANIASHCAWVAADHILEGKPFDARWGQRVEDAMWAFAGPVTAWTNAFLQPPPAHVVGVLQAAAAHRAVADAFVDLFSHPTDAIGAFATPDAADAFIAHACDSEYADAGR